MVCVLVFYYSSSLSDIKNDPGNSLDIHLCICKYLYKELAVRRIDMKTFTMYKKFYC